MTEDKCTNKILLIGASGFTGGRVLYSLANRPDVQVTCFLREGSELKDVPENMTVTVVRGCLEDQDSLEKAMAGKDGLIYVASLGFGHAETVVKAAEKSSLKKCVFTSTTAIFTKLNASSKRVRKAAEETILASDLNWTIIRPTMIFGRKGDRNMERLVRYLKKLPVVFAPGGGNSYQQPNFVDDVASALVAAYFSGNTVHREYNISGAEPLTFSQVVEKIGEALDKKVWLVPLPLDPCLWLARQLETLMYRFKRKPFLKAEQLLRLNEDKVFSHDSAIADFGYTPHSFEESIEVLVKDLARD